MTNAAVASGKHVLVVEDDDHARDICECTLRVAGWDVATVRTIEEASREIRHRRPDLVVLDRCLPDGGGDELLGRWKTNALMKDVPVVMITARSSDDPHSSPCPWETFTVKRSSGDTIAITLARVLRQDAAKSLPRHHAPSRASLTLVYPCGDDRAMPSLQEHEGMLQVRCCQCLRGSPTLGGHPKEAEARAVELGWSPRRHGWACPVCIERHKTARHH